MPSTFAKSVLASAVYFAFSPLAFADDAAKQDDDSQIEKITVAGKRIAVANNNASQVMIEQKAPISSVLDTINNLPGISINQGDAFGGDDWSTTITMRGFTIDSNQQQIGMTIDGLPNGNSNYGGGAKANRYIGIQNLATVDVTQGTSDLSSASLEALGGTFNFISKDPSMERETTIEYTTGSHDAKQYFARHETGEIFENTYAYLSYADTETKRWIGSGSNGGFNNQHAELKFVSDINDDFTLTGRISYNDVHEDNYNSVSVEQFNQTPDWDQLTWNWTGVPHLDQMFAEGWSTLRENTFAYLKFDYQATDSFSIQVTPYHHRNKGRGDWIPPYLVNAVDENGIQTDRYGSIESTYGFTDGSGNPLSPSAGCTANYEWPWNSGPGLHPACYPRDAVPVMSFRHTHYKKSRNGLTASAELELDNHALKAGIWYEDNKRDESRDWHKVIDARVYHHFDQTPYWTQYALTFDTTTFKWFIQDTMTFGDFTINLGVQQYLVDLEKFDHSTRQTTAKVNSDSDVLFSGGILFQATDELELFGSYSQNFAAIKDTALERDASALTDIEPETADNIELGLRYRADSFNLQATLYHIEFDNRITFLAPNADTDGINYTIGTNGSYLNVGGIESQGLEVSANWDATEDLNFYASYTNNDSEYVGNAPGFTKGERVIDSIEEMWVITGTYHMDDLTISSSTKYTGDKGAADDYTLTDIRVAYAMDFESNSIDAVNLSFVVNNLFDEQYLAAGTGNGETFFIGAGKTAALTLDLRF
ncbi:TonB-dependent receptor [Shewanella sp. 202IG2-18]|uniref:TonB-dependent receptor domain-containing protein n=1 Tax=Parashewanella hymeniacidonis TaxID=2807618 RepID=UPI001961D79A|nr:TonB-dependent receptor [Parashewanella hymeniacidonis]MBM7070529.1 TonB-dependent receptor [Parashewanella hymeniacidonis]